MKIAWLSANKFGYELLKEVLKASNIDIVGVITKGDYPFIAGIASKLGGA